MSNIEKTNGDAGSGKTTKIIELVKKHYNPDKGIRNQSFELITPTNKAAAVLNNKLKDAGLPKLANTLHSVLYQWRETDEIKSRKRQRDIDSTTGKFRVDEKGEPVYIEKIEYKMERMLRESVEGKILIVDESSMVNSEIWHDIVRSDFFPEVHAFGDEKQLPPVEEYDKLENHIKRYYNFWHKLKSTHTLTHNHRQAGDLKTFVDIVKDQLFVNNSSHLPQPFNVGDNYILSCNHITEEMLLKEMITTDVIITPYHNMRKISNMISRKAHAMNNNRVYDVLPITGDKIIFIDAVKKKHENTKISYVIIPKNMCATITNIRDISKRDKLIICDVEDEMGVEHKNLVLSIKKMLNDNSTAERPRFDYAYAITAHSSQGGQWENVLFLDAWFPVNLKELRYVSMTRASKRVGVITGMSKAIDGVDADKSILVRIWNKLNGGHYVTN
jgi:exodeoxyribonuclease-5